MSELLYEEELKALNRCKLKYLVIGGFAVNLHGLYRLTRDLDLMIDISEDNLEKFINLMKKLGYASTVAIEKSKNTAALSFRLDKDDYKQIDVFLKNPINFLRAYKRRKLFKFGKTSVACVGLKDLLAMKELAGRDRDWIDIGYLRKKYGMDKS